jgi:hypothetical protein
MYKEKISSSLSDKAIQTLLCVAFYFSIITDRMTGLKIG